MALFLILSDVTHSTMDPSQTLIVPSTDVCEISKDDAEDDLEVEPDMETNFLDGEIECATVAPDNLFWSDHESSFQNNFDLDLSPNTKTEELEEYIWEPPNTRKRRHSQGSISWSTDCDLSSEEQSDSESRGSTADSDSDFDFAETNRM